MPLGGLIYFYITYCWLLLIPLRIYYEIIFIEKNLWDIANFVKKILYKFMEYTFLKTGFLRVLKYWIKFLYLSFLKQFTLSFLKMFFFNITYKEVVVKLIFNKKNLMKVIFLSFYKQIKLKCFKKIKLVFE